MILSFCKFFIFMHNMYKPLFKLSFRNYKVDKLPILAINLLWFHFYSSTYPHFTHNHIYHQYFVVIVQSLILVQLFATPGLTGSSFYSLKDSQESVPTPKFKSINSSVLSLLYGPTLTSIHDYWKNHSFD